MWVSTPTQIRPALISRPVDFWLLGGGSLLALAALLVMRRLSMPVNLNAALWIFWAPYLRIVIEYPHLFASYRLAYAPGKGLVRSHPWTMIAAPVVLVLLAVFCILARDISLLGSVAAGWAEALLSSSIHLVFLGFGWHRLRQVWGCMVIYARYDDFPIGHSQRRATNVFLMAMWIFGYLTMMHSQNTFNFFGITVAALYFPDWVMHLAACVFALSGIYFLFEVFIRNAYVHRRLPTLNFMMPITALIFWWAALSLEPAFFFYLAPTFHALQYMNVVWAVDKGTWARRGLTFLGLAGLGLLIERMPQIVPALPKETAVIAVAYIGLSLHHYLLDSVIWKSSGEAWRKLAA